MTFIFPYRVVSNQPSASNALLATTASAAQFPNIPVQSVFTASVVTYAGDPGVPGSSPTCGPGIPGPSGSNGPQGDAGQNATCPAGSVPCTGITPPSGYTVVCVEIPAGCTSGYVLCPPTIYTTPAYRTPSVAPTPTPTPTPSAPPCLPFGEICSGNEQCCSNNCFEGTCGNEL